jgi:cytidyltransferase-like protein
MIYTDRKYLTILKLQDDSDTVSFDVLKELLMERPSNMIYCEKYPGGVYGIISMGDIGRAADEGRDFVKVNRNFTKLSGREYMRARKIFHENEKINALPVVDEENRLIGDYARWDDHLTACEFDTGKYAKAFWENRKKVALVMPGEQFPGKRERMEQWKSYLDAMGCATEVVRHCEVGEANDRNDLVLFADQEELRGMKILYAAILGKTYEELKFATLESISGDIHDYTWDELWKMKVDDALQKISASGVYLMTLNFDYRSAKDYWADFYDQIDEKYAAIGKERVPKLYEEWWENFFDEYYSYDYAQEISTYSSTHPSFKKKGAVYLKDNDTKLYHIKNGERLTVGQPEKYTKSIYFFGPCFVVGQFVEDAHTLESFLQEMLNQNDYKVRVVNCGSWSDKNALLTKISQTKFRQGDIAVIFDESRHIEGIPSLNLGDCWMRERLPVEWAVDHPWHCNYKANRVMANEIYEFLKDKLQEKSEQGKTGGWTPRENGLVDTYLETYFSDFRPDGVIGAIVMNCNPFTKGHRYLIEQALPMVDHLIIFVVEEDKSLFSFKERLAMVREGTKDLKNVTVVPSGNFILSQLTFPEYFLKIEDEDLTDNTEYDITLFAEAIAPKLHITYRFVGEEREDEVTAAYNLAMKKILPEHGIRLVEIPRKKVEDRNDTAISASLVRKRLEQESPEELADLLPESTVRVLGMSWENQEETAIM